jgi:hypothetical protein
MSTILRSFGFSCALVICALSSAARADIVFSNFGPFDAFANSGRLVQGPAVGTIGDVNQAAAFTVGSLSYALTSLELGISTGGPSPGTGPIDVVLAADAAGLPGAALRVFPLNVNVSGKQIITAADDGSFQLDANTTYWVIADGEGSFDGGWYINSIGDTGPNAGQTEGNPWNLHGVNDERYALRVQGRPVVPEPAAIALLTTAVLLTSGSVRRRRAIA